MNEKQSTGKKLKKLSGAEELYQAIQKLEQKKKVMEKDLKNEAEGLFENLNPVTALDKTLQKAEELSPSDSSLLKEAIAFGAGYLSKRKLIRQFKKAFLTTVFNFNKRKEPETNPAKSETKTTNTMDNPPADERKKNYFDSSIEKVKAKPENLPAPTYWPFFFALGIVFLGWGLLTTWLISLAGLIIMITSLTGWINILRHE